MKTLKTIVIIILLCLITVNIYGFFVCNQGCKPFPEQCNEGLLKSSTTLEPMIIQAAGYFLQSYSIFKRFQVEFELSATNGIDFPELLGILNGSILNLELANSLYFEIWEMSLKLDYDLVVIEKLKSFDYTTYRDFNELIPGIFNQVECLLKEGDVRGVFLKTYLDTADILGKLKVIRKSLYAKVMPAVSTVWQLNQSYITFDLFGQYCSEIFLQL